MNNLQINKLLYNSNNTIMKKSFLIIATTALIMSSCSNTDLRSDIQDDLIGIDFSTFTSKQTKAGAENSGMEEKNGLSTHHTSFKVWGSKTVDGTTSSVFGENNNKGTVVSYSSSTWSYSPVRFWDKSASGYNFYAAAPKDYNWVFTSGKLSLADFAVDGTTIAASSTIDPNANFGAKDIMISEDVENYTTYTSAAVDLNFIHLLSRLNIGIKKATPSLDHTIVKLKSIKVFNMVSNGSFNEASANASQSGNHSRWGDAATPAKFTSGVGYTTETAVTTSYNYVYQSLVIPQEVAYESGIKMDGTNINTSTSKPYITIQYEFWTEDVAASTYSAEEAALYNIENGLTSGDEGYKSAGDTKPEVPSYKLDSYSYTYNLADIFNGNGNSTNYSFNEGWMNTLKITIDPIAIQFEPEVYEWKGTTDVDVNVPDINS